MIERSPPGGAQQQPAGAEGPVPRVAAEHLASAKYDALIRMTGALSVRGSMLSSTYPEAMQCEARDQGAHAQRRGEQRVPMPIMLATSGEGQDIDRVTAMLDEQGIPYSVVFVESYSEPRLQVGTAELVGAKEISEHISEIRDLALV